MIYCFDGIEEIQPQISHVARQLCKYSVTEKKSFVLQHPNPMQFRKQKTFWMATAVLAGNLEFQVRLWRRQAIGRWRWVKSCFLI